MEVWQVVALLGGVIASGALHLFRTRTQRAARRVAQRQLREAPGPLVDNAAVTLVGIARAVGDPLVAPLSGRLALAYRAGCRVELGTLLYDDITRSELVAFELVTATTTVLVDSTSFELVGKGLAVIPHQPIREEAFLIAAGKSLSLARGATFDELIIEPGATISVHGTVAVEIAAPGSESGYRETATRHRLIGDPDHPLAIGLVT